MHGYLTDRKHRTKINNSFVDFIDLLIGVPKALVLRPDLFNIYICDLYFFIEEENVACYADDTAAYSSFNNFVTVLEDKETKGKMSYLKTNPGKSQLLLTSKEEVFITIKFTTITNSSEKLLGVLKL